MLLAEPAKILVKSYKIYEIGIIYKKEVKGRIRLRGYLLLDIKKNRGKRIVERYFVIDQQIARHFVNCSECLSNPLPF